MGVSESESFTGYLLPLFLIIFSSASMFIGPKVKKGNKSLIYAYLWWFFGGLGGLHHFYLGRDIHCLLLFSSLGGFGFGWIYDFFRIPEYVDEINKAEHPPQHVCCSCVKEAKREKEDLLSFRVLLCLTSYCMTLWSDIFVVAALNSYITNHSALLVIRCFARALVAYGCFSAGFYRSSFRHVLIGSLLSEFLMPRAFSPSDWWTAFVVNGKELTGISKLTSTAVPTIIASRIRREHKKRRHFVFRLVFVLIGMFVIICLAISAIYNHSEISVTGKSSESDKNDIFGDNSTYSEVYREIKQICGQVKKEYDVKGPRAAFEVFVRLLGIVDENAPKNEDYEILGLDRNATDAEIKAKYRMLARKHHPDKDFSDEAASMMARINEAYERLTGKTSTQSTSKDEL